MKNTTWKLLSLALLALLIPQTSFAEYESDDYENEEEYIETESSKRVKSDSPTRQVNGERRKRKSSSSYRYKTKRYKKKSGSYSTEGERRKFFVEDQERVDAGIFHVGLIAGGNFWVEPKVDATTNAPTGEFFKDFGFQLGVIFDYDYIDTNLSLRGKVGYKYILNSVHVFHIDAIARLRIPFSEKVQFTLGPGVTGGLWFREITSQSPDEEVAFLPSLVIHTGFDFNPFTVEFNWLINRFGEDNTITGMDLSFGVRL